MTQIDTMCTHALILFSCQRRTVPLAQRQTQRQIQQAHLCLFRGKPGPCLTFTWHVFVSSQVKTNVTCFYCGMYLFLHWIIFEEQRAEPSQNLDPGWLTTAAPVIQIRPTRCEVRRSGTSPAKLAWLEEFQQLFRCRGWVGGGQPIRDIVQLWCSDWMQRQHVDSWKRTSNGTWQTKPKAKKKTHLRRLIRIFKKEKTSFVRPFCLWMSDRQRKSWLKKGL